MITRSGLFALLLVVSALPAVGCASRIADEAADPNGTSASAGALTIDTRTETTVSGRFTQDGAAVSFELSRDGDGKHLRVSTVAGGPLVESLIHDNGAHTTRLLGGRLVVERNAEAVTTYAGDRAAEEVLHAMPEAACLGGLEPALVAAKVDSALLPTNAPAAVPGDHADLKPEAFYGSPFAVYYPCGAWTPPNSQALCGSSFLGYTSFIERNCTSGYAMVVYDGVMDLVPPARNGSCGATSHGGWYWGMNVPLVNMSSATIYYGH